MADEKMSAEEMIGVLRDFERGDWSACSVNETAARAADIITALQAFKTYVHQRLDVMGVDACEGKGCRVGARLDLVVADKARLREALAPFAAVGRVLDFYIEESWPLDYIVPRPHLPTDENCPRAGVGAEAFLRAYQTLAALTSKDGAG